MTFADAHCDFLSKAVSGCSLDSQLPGQAITYKSMRQGGLKAINMAAFCGDGSKEQMLDNVLKQAEIFDIIAPGCGRERMLKGNVRAFLSLEGLDYITSANELEPLLDLPIISAGIMWNRRNALGGGALEEGPLTHAGREVVKRLEESAVLIDLAHACPQTFYNVCDIIERPFVSHANVRAITPSPRNLDPDQIKLLIERKSFMGITFFTGFAGPDIKSLMRHIDFVLELGGEDILGIGSDFDGCDKLISPISSPAHYCVLASAMRSRGYKKSIIEKICYKNYIDFISSVL